MKKASIIIIFFWFCIVCLFVVSQESVQYFGKEVILQVKPLDPRDILRGDYVNLEFNISKYQASDNETLPRFKFNKPIYVALKTDDNNIAQIDYISQNKKPKDKLFIKGELYSYIPAECMIKYGIESFFVKQNTGSELEKELNSGGFAKVKIDKFGRAKIISIDKNLPI